MIFDLLPGGTNFIENTAKKTRVIVINRSEVYGSYKGLRDSRTRSVFIHHGIADCDINSIQGDTPIIFKDVDYNILSDQPECRQRGRRDGCRYSGLNEVNLSYDTMNTGVFRDGPGYQQILIPSPEFYDEKDMVLLGNREENYMDKIIESTENRFTMSSDKYIDSLYQLTLNDLLDQFTRVYRLNIKIDNLSSQLYSSRNTDEFNEIVTETVAQLKWALEKSGFCGAEIILDGDNGFNVTKLKSYMDMDFFEKKFNWMQLCNNLSELNYTALDGFLSDKFSLITTISYENVNVKIIDKVHNYDIPDAINKTDKEVGELGSALKLNLNSAFNYTYA